MQSKLDFLRKKKKQNVFFFRCLNISFRLSRRDFSPLRQIRILCKCVVSSFFLCFNSKITTDNKRRVSFPLQILNKKLIETEMRFFFAPLVLSIEMMWQIQNFAETYNFVRNYKKKWEKK